MKLKYSAHTLHKLHERAAGILELITYCERMQKQNLITANNYRKNNFFPHGTLDKTIQHHIKESWRCRKIGNYLKKRYINLMTRINP